LSFVFKKIQSELSWHVGHQGDIILYFDSPKKVFKLKHEFEFEQDLK
jgi:hypothetical protein